MSNGTTRQYGRIQGLAANKLLGIVVTAVLMLALAFIVNVFNVPNPNMILVTGLVICTSIFGYAGGIVAAIVMMAYTLAFFSTGGDFVTFTEQNMQKVVVTAIGVVVIAFFVSALRAIVSRTLSELEQLNEVLEEDNHLLEAATAVDSLTGTRNRFGLRRDFAGYLDQQLHVLMLDIDNFKQLNDTYGHQTGDYVLHEVGRSLNDICAQDHVYRYGGDEFLVVCPTGDGGAFDAKLADLKERIASIRVADSDSRVAFSAGYTYGTPVTQSDLRTMIHQADECLYESKNAGKNQTRGHGFSRTGD